MGSELVMRKISEGPYIPKRGEAVQYDRLGDGSWITTHVGDGKTSIYNLPAIADYDIRERVIVLEQEIAQLKIDLRELARRADGTM